MNAIQKTLENFLASSTPEQLQAELKKGNRPYFQTLDDPILLVPEPKFCFPAKVSFFQGEFAQGQGPEELTAEATSYAARAANQELALAA
jgi:hypothetical protein